MFTAIFRHFQTNATEDAVKRVVKINNITTSALLRDIAKVWGTSKITGYMFDNLTKKSLELHSFFVPDFYMAINEIFNYKGRYSKDIELKNILEALITETWYGDFFKLKKHTLDYDRLKDITYTLMPSQIEALEAYDEKVVPLHLKGYLLAADVGTGKAQSLDSLLKIPSGWKQMGDMQLGDTVITKQGSKASVIGVHPQGLKEMFRITFQDGRSTECCGEHLWKIHRFSWASKIKVINTYELIRLMSISSISSKLNYIDLIDSEDCNDIKLPLDPYLLGVLLGDGHFGIGRVHISTPDIFIVNEIIKTLPENVSLQYKDNLLYVIVGDWTGKLHTNCVLDIIRELGLSEKLSYEKFIPELYFNGSTQQRLALLQGLMDTDGTADLTGSSSFCSTSMMLAMGVQYLVRSLGGIARISERYPRYTHNGCKEYGRITYQVNIRYKKPEDLFRLPKKKSRVSNFNQYSKHLKLRITNIEPIGKKEAQCITIDHPDHLYVTDNFITTHNSIIGIGLAACLNASVVIVVCPKYIIDAVWVDAVKVQYKGTKRIWKSNENAELNNTYDYYIFHYEALDKALLLFNRFQFTNPVIILDESHNLNDIKSLRTKIYLDMCKASKSKNIIHESGTAIKALGTETIPLFRAIDDYFTPEVEEKFKGIYGRSATRALEILNHRLGMVSHKLSKDVVMKDVAKPIRKELRIKLPDASKFTLPNIRIELQRFVSERFEFYKKEMHIHDNIYLTAVEIYKKTLNDAEAKKAFKLYEDYVTEMRRGYDNMTMGYMSMYCNNFEKEKIIPLLGDIQKKEFKNSKSVYKYVDLKIMGEFLGGVLGRRRAELHSSLIAYSDIDKIVNDAEKKTICFTNYVDTALIAKKYFSDRGFEPIMVYGDTNKDVANILEVFKTSDTANPLIATIQSLSTGVTLICANVCIFLNLPFRSSDYEQASNRIFRIGQTAQVYLYDIILDTGDIPNLSTRMSDIMNWSKDQVNVMLGSDIGSVISVNNNLTISVESLVDYMFINDDVDNALIDDIDNKPVISLKATDWI